ncbi:hypothetical protein LTR27_011219 [Elasticomyces elasticus]|nr:hypothetical protein LTR27_011219 [Elasticomyces elasticus]
MAPQGVAYNIDWVYSISSNVHVANHRDWFTTYTPFGSQIGSLLLGGGVEVQGVGEVELELRQTSTQGRDRKPSKKLIMKVVLYVPGYTCNVVAGNNIRDFGVTMTFDEKLTDPKTEETVALLDHVKLSKLLLKGQPLGTTSLDPKRHYYISARWEQSEVERWKNYQGKRADGYEAGWAEGFEAGRASVQKPSKQSDGTHESLTDKEKVWLKTNYGGEWKFLRSMGLNIYDEEDREEGRSIIKTMMSDDPQEPDVEEAGVVRHIVASAWLVRD